MPKMKMQSKLIGYIVRRLAATLNYLNSHVQSWLECEEPFTPELTEQSPPTVNDVPVLVWAINTNAECTYVNQTWLTFTGRSLAQELGNGWIEGVHPDDQQHCLTTLLAAFHAREPFSVEHRLRRAGGDYRWMLNHGLPQFQANQFTGYIGSCVDITATYRRQTEEISLSQDLREAIFNESADALFLVDPVTLLTLDCNERAVALFEAESKAALISIEGHTLQRYSFTAGELSQIADELASQGFWSREIEYVTRRGNLFWGNLAAKQITVAGRTLNLVRVTDISARKQAELSLKRTNQLLAAISDAQTRFITDADPGVLFANLLEALLQLTDSEYGFLGEILYSPNGQPYVNESYMKMRGKPYLKTKAITDIAWNEETRNFYDTHAPQGMEFHNLNTLFGQVIVTGQPVISNHPSTDPRRGGTPAGHPPLKAFLGVPFYQGEQLMGMVGIANRPDGYNAAVIAELEPFLITCASTIEAYRHDARRKQAELALQHLNAQLEERVQQRTLELIQSEQDLRTIFNNVYDAILIHDQDGTILDVNDRALELHSVTRKQLLTAKISDLASPDAPCERLPEIYQQVQAGKTMRFEWKNRRFNANTTFDAEVFLRKVTLGNCPVYIACVRDITERKRVEDDRKQAEARLQEQEQLYRALVETSPDIIERFDTDLRHLYVSPTLTEITGLPPEVFLGKTCRELKLDAAMVQSWETAAAAVLATGENQTIEFAIPTANRIRSFEMLIAPELNREGTIQSIVCISRDITDRKQAEAQLREQEQILRSIYEGVNQPISVADVLPDNSVCYVGWNPTAAKLAGKSSEDIAGKSVAEVFSACEAAEISQRYAQCIAAKQPLTFEECLTLQGQTHWMITTFNPLIDQEGQVHRVVATVYDITQRKQAEQALQASEEKLRLAAEAADLGVWDGNLLTGTETWSPKTYELFGFTKETFDGKTETLYRRLHPEDQAIIRQLHAQAQQTGSYRAEYRVIHPNQTIRWISTRGQVFFNEAGIPCRMVGVSIDITERKQVELALRESEEGFRQINAELERRVEERTIDLQHAMEAAEAANRAKTAFLANMSHELRTPLNAILGFSQLLNRDNSLDADQQEQLNIINRSGEHLLNLINDILAMSKIEAGRITLTVKSFDLQGLLKNLEDLFRLKAEAKGLTLVIEIDVAVPRYIQTDENKLRQVLINLLSNAVKFTVKGRVVLRVQKEEPEYLHDFSLPSVLRFEVEDTGFGIDPSEWVAVFEPFRQTQIGQESQEGTGLGLPISRQFVQLMGGELGFTSTSGQGSTFYFTVPVGLAQADDLLLQTPLQRVIGLAAEQPNYRLLVVEDNWENRQFLVQLLQSVGFEVQSATNGQEAINLWQSWAPHLIWMDMRMPVMDGYTATKQIRELEQKKLNHSRNIATNADVNDKRYTGISQPTKIIALTASAFEDERTAILATGCDDFVSKPATETLLFEKIAEHLSVRYVYQTQTEDRSPAEAIADHLLSPKALQVMPCEWIAQLQRAARIADEDLILELLDQIPPNESWLANALREIVSELRLDKLIELTS
jgi:PAS domain S-box-containing protein